MGGEPHAISLRWNCVWVANMRHLVLAGVVGLIYTARVGYGTMTHQYTFNDGTAKDSVGAVNGTLVNGASVIDGSLVFDKSVNTGSNTDPGIGQYMTLPRNILHTPDFTIEAWVTNTGGQPWQRILDFGNSVINDQGVATGKGFIILTNNGCAQISVSSWGNADDTDLVSGGTIGSGEEHHVVYTHSFSDKTTSLYVDGKLVRSGLAHVDPSTAEFSNFWIGRSQFSVDPFFAGSINELRVYDNAITSGQVLADFTAGPTGGAKGASAPPPAPEVQEPPPPAVPAATDPAAAVEAAPAVAAQSSAALTRVLFAAFLFLGMVMVTVGLILQRRKQRA
jgi:hypothetical protein